MPAAARRRRPARSGLEHLAHSGHVAQTLVDLRAARVIGSDPFQRVAQLLLRLIQIAVQNKILRARLMQADNIAGQTLRLGQ